ncbi:MAG: NYN domain-containing protein [Spirochaetales bacterium]|nr:NYN domain-containing protein [Spirochaetales bacterium]
METNEIAAIWDIENVTPSYQNLFVDGLFDYIRRMGHLSLALAIADWRSNISNKLALNLSENGFELIHIPQPEKKSRRKKNSSDLTIISKATEIIFQYPHINSFILITGDIDFRPLLQTLRRYGKRTVIICDSNTASESLLEFADEYMDYRNLLPDDDVDIQDSGNQPEEFVTDFTTREAYKLLAEAITFMLEHEKKPTPGSIKIRMKLLNENFSGTVKGFRQWSSFIRQAAKDKIILLEESDKGIVLSLPESSKTQSGSLHEIFRIVLSILEDKNPENNWVDFSQVSKLLLERKVSLKNYKYNKLKKLILDAEKRGLVEVRNEEFRWSVRRKPK